MSIRVVRFGSFELDCSSRELREGGRCLRLQEQPFGILCMLLERPGDVVTREELHRRLWPAGTFVDFDHSLNAAVRRLRTALGDDATRPRFVETVPRCGYRLVAAVQPSAAPASQAMRTPRPRLAVLPFSNLSEDSTHESFSDGLTEEMIAQLGTLCRERLRVLSRWSSMAFKGSLQRAREVGEALRADYLLEGSVRRDGTRVRVTARLLETTDETQIWSYTCERDAIDSLAIQAELATLMARSIVSELAGRTSPRGAAPPDAEAYQAYLKGLYFWHKPGDTGLDQALVHLGEGLRIAPTFAAAHAARALAMVSRAEYYREVPRVALVSAREAALRALELDANETAGHVAMAGVLRMLDFDWCGAEASCSRALALEPTHHGARRSFSLMLSALARHDEAIRESEYALELDPFCLLVAAGAAWTRYAAGDYVGAIARCRHTLDMDPDYVVIRRLLGAAQLQAGRAREALATLEGAVAVRRADPVTLSWLAHARAVTGARAEAHALMDRIRALETATYVPRYHLALAHTGLDDHQRAFELLGKAWHDRDPMLTTVAGEPRFAPLRDDARYVELLERLNNGRIGNAPGVDQAAR